MNNTLKLIVGVVALVLVIAGALVSYNALKEAVKPEMNIGLAENEGTVSGDTEATLQKAPDFTVIDTDGNSVSLSDMLGKPVVLNFWASWCPPCKGEMPEFDSVYAELGDEVQFMMVDLTDGQRETLDTAKDYINEQGYSFPVFFDTQQEGAYKYGIQSIPTTFFIDKDGNIVTGVKGAIDESTLRKGIDLIR